MKTNRTLIMFYVLVGYVLIQFVWWAWSIVNLNHEIYLLKNEIINLQNLNSDQYYEALKQLHDKLDKRKIMVLTEGSVFLLILLWGIWLVRSSFMKEMQLSKQQKNFLMSVTHELRSPLASTKLQLETLLRHDLERSKQQQIISNAISDTERLNQLVENILIATNIENAEYPIHPERIDLSALVNERVKKLQSIFASKALILAEVQEAVEMDADKHALISVVNNLIENAIKYKDPENGAEVFVKLKKEQHKIILSVSDKGIGIPDNEKKNIFMKFYRSGNEETRKTKGTGLGLYIVLYFVQKHQGKIFVKNNKPKGTIFEIEFNQA